MANDKTTDEDQEFEKQQNQRAVEAADKLFNSEAMKEFVDGFNREWEKQKAAQEEKNG